MNSNHHDTHNPIRRWLPCLLLLTTHALAAPSIVASFTDPAGDDNGDGKLLYPMSRDFQEGDLDLRAFTVSRDADGFWLEATFANPIREPGTALMGAAADSAADFVRKGFYTFNIDVYVDTDRRRSSGNTFTLPGRHVRIDPAYAWEKAIVLTPRPQLMRTELLDALRAQYPDQAAAEIEDNVDRSIHFPTRVKVRGKTVAFFVPQAFFGDSDGSDWAVTVLVTGAKLQTSAGGGLVSSGKTPLEELDLGVLQTSPGRSPSLFGYTGRGAASPVVDTLLPGTGQQTILLGNRAPLTGVSWGKHAADDAAMAARSEANLRAAAGARPEPAAAGGGSFLKGLLGESAPKSSPRSAAASPVGALLDPVPPKPAPGEVASPAKAGVATRLQTLKKLLDDGLITEPEFNQHKARILGDL
jgi:hypothetical protein